MYHNCVYITRLSWQKAWQYCLIDVGKQDFKLRNGKPEHVNCPNTWNNIHKCGASCSSYDDHKETPGLQVGILKKSVKLGSL